MSNQINPSENPSTSQAQPSRLSRIPKAWLPTPGNALFTLCVLFLLLSVQSVGALSSNQQVANTLPSRGMIDYQGQLTDTDNQPLDGNYRMRFALYDSADAETPLWEEEWSEASIENLF
ncbi:MAG: hypothetical protein HC837_01175 [Chloroflexaceae bacterium]|nr:hypothetical protein [Chloroflexaceae bacterium]